MFVTVGKYLLPVTNVCHRTMAACAAMAAKAATTATTATAATAASQSEIFAVIRYFRLNPRFFAESNIFALIRD